MIRRINILVMVLITFFTINILMGCAGDINIAGEQNNEKLNIVCTTFPQYDWVSELIKGNEENITLTLLMDKGGDLHNFQPSVLDIARVSACDMFIYVGGESDNWVDDAINEATNSDMCVINMMEVIDGNAIEHKHEHESEEGHGHTDHTGHEHGFDEHVWLSLRNAERIVHNITHELTELDSANADLYISNYESYVKELRSLDDKFIEAVKKGDTDTLLFADRFPFIYFVEDYGLHHYAAFDGCSAETEASFETVAQLSHILDTTGLDCVLVIDGSDKRLAQVIIENSKKHNQKILVFNSLQAVSKKDIEGGASYLSIMNKNLETLEQALSLN